jgi:hypothetical protein
MYDKKGKKSWRKHIIQRDKEHYEFLKERKALEIKLFVQKKRLAKEAKEREIALRVPETTLVKARKPTKDAPTQAEQDRGQLTLVKMYDSNGIQTQKWIKAKQPVTGNIWNSPAILAGPTSLGDIFNQSK